MELDEIEKELCKFDDLYVKGHSEDNTKMVDEAENGIGSTYENIEQNQFDMLSNEAYAILESHGFNDNKRCVPYHEGWT